MHSRLSAILVMLVICAAATLAQTTEFSYQGKLNDGSNPANASYDFEFRLYDSVSSGTQIGPALLRTVAVADGIFTVSLDFGPGFPGADRFLEIAVKPSSAGSFTTLSPRQRVASSPYAIKSLEANTATNATQLGGVAANQFVQAADPRLTDARSPAPGSTSYIQNGTNAQASSNFNISGTGTAARFNAGTDYQIAGERVLGIQANDSTFVGRTAGLVSTGNSNSIFGSNAGRDNTTGNNNSFFGFAVGLQNISGRSNSYFGESAGRASNADFNSFFGALAGQSTTGGSNVIIGANTGATLTIGSNNTLVGKSADVGANNLIFATAIGAGAIALASSSVVLGRAVDTVRIPGNLNVAGPVSGVGFDDFVNRTSAQSISGTKTFTSTLNGTTFNATTQYNIGGSRVLSTAGIDTLFVGDNAGAVNTGASNVFVGGRAGFRNTDGGLNTMVGNAAGQNNLTGDGNSFFGGNAGNANTSGLNNSFIGYQTGFNTTEGDANTFLGRQAGNVNTVGNSNTAVGDNADFGANNLSFATAVGAGAVATESSSVWLGRAADIVYVPGFLRLVQLGGAGGTALCRNNNNTIGPCSPSSLRYKTNVDRFGLGLDIVKKLKPITFDYKDGGMHDLGLGAEDVASIEPLLAIYNKDGHVEGVKYDRIGVVLINAVKEQQAQIERQQRTIDEMNRRDRQQSEAIDALRKLVCRNKSNAPACKE